MTTLHPITRAEDVRPGIVLRTCYKNVGESEPFSDLIVVRGFTQEADGSRAPVQLGQTLTKMARECDVERVQVLLARPHVFVHNAGELYSTVFTHIDEYSVHLSCLLSPDSPYRAIRGNEGEVQSYTV